MSAVILTLPYPISANRYWRTYMPKGFKAPVTTLSSEAKAYKEQVGWLVKAAGVQKPLVGRVQVEVKLYPHRPLDWQKRMRTAGAAWDDSVQCIDLDNANKVLLDSLKGVAIEDDKWVRRIVAERMEPDGEARVVIRIEPIAVEVPQPALFGEVA
jgi:crossover junction endodeoxyribonuclease RusA